MIPTFSVKFDLDSTSDTYKQLVLTDTTDWGGAGYVLANMRGYFRVTFPDGTVRAGSSSTVDVNWSLPDSSQAIDLPAITGGGVQTGTYTVEYTAFASTATGTLLTSSKTVAFEPFEGVFDCGLGKVKDPTIKVTVNCHDLVLTAKNTTSFGAPISAAHSLSLEYPSEAGIPDLVLASTMLETGFTWVNAAYAFTADSLLTYQIGSDPACTIVIRVKKTLYKIVTCDVDLCKTIECYRTFTDQLLTEASELGGYDKLSRIKLIDLNRANTYFLRVMHLTRCGLYDEAAEDADALEKILKRYVPGCNCICKNDGAPVQITPPTAATSTYSFDADYPVTVTVSDLGLVTYGLDDAFVAAVSALTATAMTSPDGSVVISEATAGGITTFSLTGRSVLDFVLRIRYDIYPIQFTRTSLSKKGVWTDPAIEALTREEHGSLVEFNRLAAEFSLFGWVADTGEPREKILIQVAAVKPRNFAILDAPEWVRVQMTGKSTGAEPVRYDFRFVDAADGLPMGMARFVNEVQYVDLHIQLSK
jgi:hypothetical protein